MMKRYVATLLLIFALLASGCNEQEPKNVSPPVQIENNPEKSITLPNDKSTPDQSTTDNVSTDAEKNALEENTGEETNGNEDDKNSNAFQGDSENGVQSNPKETDPNNYPNGVQNNPKETDQNYPNNGNQSNPNNVESRNPFVEPVKPPRTLTSFLEENMITIMVGMATVIVLLMTAVFVLTGKLKSKEISQTSPTVSPEPNKLSESPDSIASSFTPTIFESNDNLTSPRETASISSKRLAFLVGTLQNIGKREEQQDSFCVSDSRDEQLLRQKGFMAVVADGMGGLEGGAKISKLVASTFLQSYTRQFVSSTANFLYNTAATAEKEVEKLIEREGITGGSTLVAIMIKDYELNFISVGDSHIYLFQNGILTQLNREHNYGAILKEKAARNEISPEEPYRNSQRHSLTAYIGMGSFNIADKNSYPITLKPGDKVFLCSDGVYNALGDDILTTLLKSDALTAAKKIETNILSQNLPKQDNFTGVVVELYEK